MSRLLPSQLNRVSVNKTEQVMEPQEPKLHVVRFNPLLTYNDNNGNTPLVFTPYMDAYNNILEEQGLPPISFKTGSTFTLDRTKQSKDLDLYNNIGDFVSSTLNTVGDYKSSVPETRKEQLTDTWTDFFYGLIKETQKQTNGLNTTDRTNKGIKLLANQYMKGSVPMIRETASEQANAFQNSKYPGITPGFSYLGSALLGGVSINTPDLLDFMEGDVTMDMAKRIRANADAAMDAQGFGTMSYEDLVNDKNKSISFTRVMATVLNDALISAPQQIPSALSSIGGFALSKFPLAGLVSSGVGLGAGYLQESGNMVLGLEEEYHKRRTRAKNLKRTLLDPNHPDYNPSLFANTFTVNLQNGKYKTMDEMTDEDIRKASESIARQYGLFSTGLEMLNTAGDIALGRYASGLKSITGKNPKAVIKTFFKKFVKSPYTQAFGLEASTEASQELMSEIIQQTYVPEYDMSPAQIFESGVIGGLYGLAFTGGGRFVQKMRRNKKNELSLSEVQLSSANKEPKEKMESTPYDADIIVGIVTGNVNAIEDIAKYHGVSVEEVAQRETELGSYQPQLFDNINFAKDIIKKDESILEKYPEWENPFPPIKKVADDIGDIPGVDGEPIQEPDVGDGLPEAGIFEPDNIDDVEAGLGLDLLDGNQEMSVELQQVRAYEARIKALEETDDPNIIASNQKRNEIADLKNKRDALLSEISRDKVKNKTANKIKEKQQIVSDSPVVGEKVIIRTPALQGTTGEIIGTLESQGRNNIVVVKTQKGLKKIKIDNVEFKTPREPLTNFQKSMKGFKRGSAVKQKTPQGIQQKIDNIKKQYIVKGKENTKMYKTAVAEIAKLEKQLGKEPSIQTKENTPIDTPKQAKEKIKKGKDYLFKNLVSNLKEALDLDPYDFSDRLASVDNRTIAKLIVGESMFKAKPNKEQSILFKKFGIQLDLLKEAKKIAINEESDKIVKEFTRAELASEKFLEESYENFFKEFNKQAEIFTDGTIEKYIKENFEFAGMSLKDVQKQYSGKEKIAKSMWESHNEGYKKFKKDPISYIKNKIKNDKRVLKDFSNNKPSDIAKLLGVDYYKKSLQNNTDALNALIIKQREEFNKELNKDIESRRKKKPVTDEDLEAQHENGEEPFIPDEDFDPEKVESSQPTMADLKKQREARKARKTKDKAEVVQDENIPPDYVDGVFDGTNEIEDEVDNIIPEQDAQDNALGMVGKHIDEIFGDLENDIQDGSENIEALENVDFDDSNEGQPGIILTGAKKRRFDARMEQNWKAVKNKFGLTESMFNSWTDQMDKYMENTPFSEAWRLWSEARKNSGFFKKAIRKLEDRIKVGIGDKFLESGVLDDEFAETMINAFEYTRENIGNMEGILEVEDMNVKDYSKIAREFFVRFNFKGVDVEKMQQIYDLATSISEETGNVIDFDDFVEALSTQEMGLESQEGYSLQELIQLVPEAKRGLRVFYNSVHPMNRATKNRGVEGEVVEWEVIMHYASLSLKTVKNKYGKVINKLRGFQATQRKGYGNKTRPDVGLKMFYTRFIEDSMFSVLKGKDIFMRDVKTKLYGFLNTTQVWNLYRDALIANGLVPIASRGEDSKLIFASVTDAARKHAKNIKGFIQKEVTPFRKLRETAPEKYAMLNEMYKNIMSVDNLSEKERAFLQYVFNNDYNAYREHFITKHLAMKDLFGSEYVFMKPEVLMKRIKIPFTPVHTSPTLPDRQVVIFNSEGATITYEDDSTVGMDVVSDRDGDRRLPKSRVVKLVQNIDGTGQYIGDGTTITSESVFAEEYPEHFGTHPNAKRAKTVQYYKEGDDVLMAKHQEMTFDLPYGERATIKDGKGMVVAYIMRDPNTGYVEIYNENGEQVHHLMSDDEAKIHNGKFADYNTTHSMPGKSIGMIQLQVKDKQKNLSSFSSQLSYYIDDQNFQNVIMNMFDTMDDGAHSPKNIGNRILELAQSGKKINQIIQEAAIRFYDVVPQNVEELGSLGVGRHPSILNYVKEILKNKMLKPLADFKMKGTHIDFRADYTGTVKRDEMVIGANNGLINQILDKAGRPKGLNTAQKRIQFANEWLKSNDFWSMAVRHPVASSKGFGLYKIKNIDPQLGDSFKIHPREVKERFEGDHDHDTAHILWLDDKLYNALKKVYKPTKGLGLNKFDKDDSNNSILNFTGTLDMIRNMTFGETAISEVVNTTRYSGALNNMFGKDGFMMFEHAGKVMKVKPRPLTMKVRDAEISVNGKKGYEGTVEELLSLYLQASVDHPKVLLLRKWKYSMSKIRDLLFYDPANPNKPLPQEVSRYLSQHFIKKILSINSIIDNQVHNNNQSAKFDILVDKSIEYNNFVEDRIGYLDAHFSQVDAEIEAMIQKGLMKRDAKLDVLYITSRFAKGSDKPTSLQEKISVSIAEVVNRMPGHIQRFFNIDPDLSKVVHTNAVRNLFNKGTILDLLEQFGEPKYNKAKIYANQLGRNLEALFEKRRITGEKGESLSFLNKMTAKSWDYSEDFIKFYNEESKKFAQLDEATQILATVEFLRGTIQGDRVAIRQDLRTLPPVKTREADGSFKSTLHPDIIEAYFGEYNSILDNTYNDVSFLNSIRSSKMVTSAQMKKELGCG